MRILRPLRRIHGEMHSRRLLKEQALKIKRAIETDEKRTVYFTLSPTHGNLGDHAIASVVIARLTETEIPFSEISASDVSLLDRFGMLRSLNGHPILINGGGNIGTLWPKEDLRIRAIIKSCPDSLIVCLPSTAFFERSLEGDRARKRIERIIRAHKSLLLCARDEYSFHLLQSLHNKVLLLPDLAMLLNKQEPRQERKGCLICLRSDRERTISDEESETIIQTIQTLFGQDYFTTDMDVGKPVGSSDREIALEKKFSEFRGAELVVTDRLHGMVFAAITATPCIVLESRSPKIRGCYEWIQHLEYIRFCNDVGDLKRVYSSIPKGPFTYDNERLLDYYAELINEIKKLK